MVLSRLDYCNSLLAGLPASAIRPLQLIQNAVARLIFNTPKYTHTTQLLTDLHWLPVIARIKFIGPCIPGNQGISPRLHPTAHQTLHTGQTSTLRYLWTSGTPPPVTPAQLVHDCSLFWPHDGGMTFLWTSEQPRFCPHSNAD